MEPFSEGLHKVVGGSTEQDSGYESDSETSVTEVRTCQGDCMHAETSKQPAVSHCSHRGLTPLPEMQCPPDSLR